MKILILNWRDIKNPHSGGAEILTHEIAKYLVKRKNTVTIFASYFPGAKSVELIDGVRVIRQGKSIARYFFNSVHFLAFREYKKHFQGNVDLVIDEVHGLPFFTPFYVSEKKIALVCEVAGTLWIKMFGIFLGTLGRLVEILNLRIIYRNVPFITISQSAKKDLIKNGVQGEKIFIIPVGVNIPKRIPNTKKELIPTVMYLGRVAKSKGVEDAILAIKELAKKHSVKLWIVGKEDEKYSAQIKEFAKEQGISDLITFYGYVSERKKFEILSKAWILIHPSKTEGWGINVIEANVVGVPAVGYNVPGLRDSISDTKTGLLADRNNPHGLSSAMDSLLTNEKLYLRLSSNAKEWAQQFDWEIAAEKSWKVITNIYEK